MAGISRGGSPLRGKLIFFAAQLPLLQDLARKTEFANPGKLSGKLATSSVDSRQIESPAHDRGAYGYSDVAGWRTDFFAWPILPCPRGLRMKSNTANSVGVAVLLLAARPSIRRMPRSWKKLGRLFVDSRLFAIQDFYQPADIRPVLRLGDMP